MLTTYIYICISIRKHARTHNRLCRSILALGRKMQSSAQRPTPFPRHLKSASSGCMNAAKTIIRAPERGGDCAKLAQLSERLETKWRAVTPADADISHQTAGLPNKVCVEFLCGVCDDECQSSGALAPLFGKVVAQSKNSCVLPWHGGLWHEACASPEMSLKL